MLQGIRDRLTGPVALGIVGLIIVPFAFWGIDSYLAAPSNPMVAEVGNDEISQAQLQRAYDQGINRLQAMLGDQFQPGMIDPPRFREGVLNNLIQDSLLNQQTRREGLSIADDMLLSAVQSETAFHKDGAFSSDQYRAVLARAGMTPSGYESELRRGLAVEQLQRGIRGSAFATQSDSQLGWRLQQQKRELSYLVYSAERYATQVQITDAMVKARYEQDKERYQIPEQVRLDYVELNRTSLKPAAVPEPEILKVIYEAEKTARFTTPEQRHARHILVRIPAGGDEAEARKKIEAIKKQLDDGSKDFAELARTLSEDSGSKAAGGDLGWVGRGTMVPEFEQSLFALDKGQISEPVKTSFGWHLIKLDDLKPQVLKPLSSVEVQQELLRLYREREADERFQQMAKRMDEMAFDEPGKLDGLARVLDSEIRTTDWVTRDKGDGIGENAGVRVAAFSDAVLKEKENSTPLELAPGRQVVLRVAEHRPARVKPLNEVTDELRQLLRREQGEKQALAAAEAARKAIAGGVTPSAQAATDGAQLTAALWLTRDNRGGNDKVPPAEVMKALFALPRPTNGKPRLDTVKLANGDQAVLVFGAVKEDESVMDVEAQTAFQARLAAEISTQEYNAYLSSLHEILGVKIKESALK